MSQLYKYDLFISYATKNSDIARYVVDKIAVYLRKVGRAVCRPV